MIRTAVKLASAAALLAFAGCYTVPPEERPALTSFEVKVKGFYQPSTNPRLPLPVVSVCQAKYQGEANVPAEVRGTKECPYAIPRGNAEVDVVVTALTAGGLPLTSFEGPISFRVIPGDVTGDYVTRTLMLRNGTGEATVQAAHMYGEVQVWAEDAAPKLTYVDGKLPEGSWTEPAERTFATGLSQVVMFEEPTIAKIQIPEIADNKTSPFIGQFLTIGRPPENGGLKQSCEKDPENDGKDALLVVTGTDPTGFFVTDLTACRQEESERRPGPGAGRVPCRGPSGRCSSTTTPSPKGSTPVTCSGASPVRCRSSAATTQLTFPSWVVAERVRTLPESEWDKWLKQVPVKEINLRTCGLDDKADPFVTDVLCAYSNSNMKMESLESALVQVKNVRFTRLLRPVRSRRERRGAPDLPDPRRAGPVALRRLPRRRNAQRAAGDPVHGRVCHRTGAVRRQGLHRAVDVHDLRPVHRRARRSRSCGGGTRPVAAPAYADGRR